MKRRSAPALVAGQVVGRWTLVERIRKPGLTHAYWNCRCACGAERTVVEGDILWGRSLSCGCLKVEGHTTHGRSRSPESTCWRRIRQYCTNPKNPHYPSYGGRGITMCARWAASFEAFFADMGPRPSPLHSIERVDVNGNYEPANCRWAVLAEQAANKRTNRRITANGETLLISEWAARLGVHVSAIIRRIDKGWPEADAVTTPPIPRALRRAS